MTHIEHLKRWLRPALAFSAMGLILGLLAACGGGSIVSCTGTVSCTATSDGVACANAPGRGVTIKRCPKVVAEA